MLNGVTGCYIELQGVTWCYMVLQGVTWFYPKGGGVLDISLGGEVRPGPFIP